MTNILRTIVAILITATLTACGQPAAKNTANVSAPTSVTVTEADSLSSYEVQTSTEVTDIPSVEPSAETAAVTPASDEAVASATSQETCPYSDYIWSWYEEVSEPANYPTSPAPVTNTNTALNTIFAGREIYWLAFALPKS